MSPGLIPAIVPPDVRRRDHCRLEPGVSVALGGAIIAAGSAALGGAAS
jgi:hypothetical protein